MTIDTRQAIKIARETAKDAGYKDATVTDSSYDDDEETYDVELHDEDADVIINVQIDGGSGEVIDFTTD